MVQKKEREAAKVEHVVDRPSEWRSKLAILTGGVLTFLTLTGLFIWLLPFSEFNQMNVILHTLIGIMFLVPVGWYSIRHWLLYRRRPITHIKLLGYLGVFVLLACAVSGLVLTLQSLFGIKISYLWRVIHRWTTIAIIVFVVPHIILIVLRDAKGKMTEAIAVAEVAKTSKAAKRYGWGALILTIFFFALVALVWYAYEPPHLMKEFSSDYEFWQPRNPLYSKNRPFAPSLARTKDNKPIDAKLLAGSEGCGTSGCHEQIVKEWRPSAHRYSALDKGFQAIQLTMAKQNGPASTRYCGGCHDPISLFSGTKNIYTDETKLTALHGYKEGVSCLTCHSVKETDVKGNAYYAIQAPPRYIGELEYDETQSIGFRLLRDFLIRAYPKEHVASLSKVMFKKPEYCAACHKQFVDEEINKVGWVQLQNQYDNWRMSKWARNLKDPNRTIECRECHMPLVKSTDPAAGDPYDYNRKPSDGMHRSHRFIAANQLMPALLKLEGSEVQTDLTEKWLKGHISIPEIEEKWHKTGVPAVSIQLIAPEKIRPGKEVFLKCIITSNKVGHDFPTGPLDIIQSWVELVVKDENGRVVYESGTVDEKGFIKPGSFIFKAEPVDQYGNLIDRHNLWEMVGVRHRRAMFPGFSDTAEFSFLCPELYRKPLASVSEANRKPKAMYPPSGGGVGGVNEVNTTKRNDLRSNDLNRYYKQFTLTAPKAGKLLVSARLRYRKIDQFLLNFIRSVGFFDEFKGKHLTSPITDMHEDKKIIEVTSEWIDD